MRKTVVVDLPKIQERITKYDQLYNFLNRSKKPQSSLQIAKQIGLPVSLVRSYLTKAVDEGFVLETLCKCCDSARVYEIQR